MRRGIAFPCEDANLFGTLDLPGVPAPGQPGLLIVSGGNEIRAGAWNGQALAAQRLADRGIAVLRFDRRGVGESEGENTGFRHSAHDIAAALAAFRREVPGLGRVTGWGNCDAASALLLGGGCGLDGLVLSNPWTFDEAEEAAGQPALSPAALRAHYLRRLANPRALIRVLSGKVSLGKLFGSLGAMARTTEQTALTAAMRAGLDGFDGPVHLLIAGRDRTAQAFLGQWDRSDPRLATCPVASHSFVEPEAQEWLENRLLDALS